MPEIAILYICTGKYIKYWDAFYQSSKEYLLPGCRKKYYVFTDGEIDQHNDPDIVTVFQKQLAFPYPTLYRFRFFLRIKEAVLQSDYVFFFNANIVFKQRIEENELLPQNEEELAAVIHPGYYNNKPSEFTLEKNKRSAAYVDHRTVSHYYMGSLMGGRSGAFMHACEIMDSNIRKDEKKLRMAVWHDESHWNKYLSTGVTYKELHPGFVYPEGHTLPFEMKALLLNKFAEGGHESIRVLSAKEKMIRWLKKQKRQLKAFKLFK